MSQGTNPTYNGEGRATLLNMIHSAPNKAELTGYKPHITGVLTSGDVADDSFLTNHLGRIYYSSLHYAGLDSLIGDSVDGSFRPITLTGLYEGTPGGGAKSISAPGASETVLMFDFEGSNNDTSTTDRSSTGHTATFNGYMIPSVGRKGIRPIISSSSKSVRPISGSPSTTVPSKEKESRAICISCKNVVSAAGNVVEPYPKLPSKITCTKSPISVVG